MPLTPEKKASWLAYRERYENESVREIGDPPEIVNPARRESCRLDLRSYLLTYHPFAFPLAFGKRHLELIATTQQIILDSGRVVTAMPRGSGKTTIFQHALLWASLYGHRTFTFLICADDKKFRLLLRGIKKVLENNDMLLEDFPEAIHPIRKLERIPIRANAQICGGEPTYMRWGTDELIFATTKHTLAAGNAGVCISGGGLTGAAVRGCVVTKPSGEQVRPSCVLIDDPQTRKSAKSQSQCQEREDICQGDIMGMAGPGKSIAAMCAVTVIYKDDLADRLLDPERHPEWTQIRVPMIESWPTEMALWEKYDGFRRAEKHEEAEPGAATEFYRKNRSAMDAGASVYWEERVNDGCLSALQSAMDDYFSDPRAFMAEKQNQPENTVEGDLAKLDPLTLVRRVSSLKRGVIPSQCTTLTAHVDVQARLLYWMVCAWTQSMGCYVVDYGTTPKQNQRYFTLNKIRRDMVASFPGTDEAGALRAAVKYTTEMLSEQTYKREDGAEMNLGRGLVDARWRSEDVEAGLKLSSAKQWMPAMGVGIKAKDAPIDKWTKRPGMVRGFQWVLQRPQTRTGLVCFFDTNFWKTECHQALVSPIEHTQSCMFFHDTQTNHQMLVDQLCAERATRVEAKGRIVDEWDLPANKPDNHYWDNLVGCRVAASLAGIRKESATNVKRRIIAGKKKVSYLSI